MPFVPFAQAASVLNDLRFNTEWHDPDLLVASCVAIDYQSWVTTDGPALWDLGPCTVERGKGYGQSPKVLLSLSETPSVVPQQREIGWSLSSPKHNVGGWHTLTP
uniref:Uncharacterized protein n=1 Tax=Eutreptiella gymnastica TaxID=73025 RepID=A0A6U8HIR9_9EUGL|mmetsp:Transcript_54732/g.97384  ORF Transcript_54732/g.97384 Transcript_54732/m.97384 type:complete len:105 (+) Transcript_54732:401-715(+)